MEIISIIKAYLNVFVLWENQNFKKEIFWKFLLMRVTETYQNKPKEFREKRIDLKEEVKGKNKMSLV